MIAQPRLRCSTLSPVRLSANRANAQLSTGPTSEAGKSVSCLNTGLDEAAVLSVPKTQAVTGLTGRTVLLSCDDAEAYRRHLGAYENEYKPLGLRECELVQSLADTQWRLSRIPGLEMAIYAQGRLELEDAFEEHPPCLRPGMIELQTHMKYEKQLRNLHIQEARLVRRYQNEMAELRQLQQARLAQEESEESESTDKQILGFEFTNDSTAPDSLIPSLEPATLTGGCTDSASAGYAQ